MAKIRITREQVQTLVNFCAKHKLDEFFMVNGHGAYIGQSIGYGPEDNHCIYYFPGCRPEHDAEWYYRTLADFGRDDFRENLPLDWLTNALAQPKMKCVELEQTKTEFRLFVID